MPWLERIAYGTLRAVKWLTKSFSELTTHELYAILALRQRVFVVEQVAAYLDCDGYDDIAEHVFAWDVVEHRPATNAQAPAHVIAPRGELVAACARLFAPGIKFAEASIGRVVCAPEWRGAGLGQELMTQSIARLEELYPGAAIRIGAQRYLEEFYGRLGFVTQSQPYLEDGIWHVEMVRALPSPR